MGKGRAAGRVESDILSAIAGRVNVSPGRVQEKWPVDNSGPACSRGSTNSTNTFWSVPHPANLTTTISSIDRDAYVRICLDPSQPYAPVRKVRKIPILADTPSPALGA